MKYHKLFILLLLIYSNSIFADTPCEIMFPSKDTSSWGIGLTHQNRVIKGTTCHTNEFVFIGKGIIRISKDSTIQPDERDYTRMGYNNENYLLKVFQISGTKYKVCSYSMKESIWIDFNDLKAKNIHFNTYFSLMSPRAKNINDYIYIISQAVPIGVNLPNSCINLRTEPSLNGEIVTCLRANSYNEDRETHIEIKLIDFYKNWAYISTTEYIYDEENDESGEGCSFKVINKKIGYVKAFDKSGRPNIWYYGS